MHSKNLPINPTNTGNRPLEHIYKPFITTFDQPMAMGSFCTSPNPSLLLSSEPQPFPGWDLRLQIVVLGQPTSIIRVCSSLLCKPIYIHLLTSSVSKSSISTCFGLFVSIQLSTVDHPEYLLSYVVLPWVVFT